MTYPDAPGQERQAEGRPTYGPGEVTLLDLPARVADAGFGTMEICHFHFPRRDPAYLAELRAAIDRAGVRLLSLLIDDVCAGVAIDTDLQAGEERTFSWLLIPAEVRGDSLESGRYFVQALFVTGPDTLSLAAGAVDQ